MKNYNHLSTKQDFNASLRHFKLVTGMAGDVSAGYNLADLINAALNEGSVDQVQVSAVLNVLLKDKFNYRTRSINLIRTINSGDKIASVFYKWTNVQIILAYFDPNSGLQAINPAVEEQISGSLPLLKDELLVIYANLISKVPQSNQNTFMNGVMKDITKVLYGANVGVKKGYGGVRRMQLQQSSPPPIVDERDQSSPETSDEAQSAPHPAASGPKRMTPRYSVFVTNELFHNGNVEAWKKIIEAYNLKYPENEILIWYENERINDINTLFKWGKVKHGTPIVFSIMGVEFKEISKLQRYLSEGASPRFENFLHGAPNQVLDIF